MEMHPHEVEAELYEDRLTIGELEAVIAREGEDDRASECSERVRTPEVEIVRFHQTERRLRLVSSERTGT